MRALLDDAVLDRPALAARVLELQVAEVDAGAEQRAKGADEPAGVQACGEQQARFGEAQGLAHDDSVQVA
jgi:hypothetical protein